MQNKSLTLAEVLMSLDDGGPMEAMAAELRSCVAAVTGTGKSGAVQLTLKVKANGASAVTITDDIKVTLPKADPAATMFYVTEDAGLSRRDPRQPSLAGTEPK